MTLQGDDRAPAARTDPAHPTARMDPAHAILFESVQIGPKVLKNRFYQVPYGPGFGNDRAPSREHYMAMRAQGGWAAVNTGICIVSPDADIEPVRADRLWTEHDAASMKGLCEEIHRYGALAGIELGHGGNDASTRQSRWPIIAPSQLASDANPMRVPKSMEHSDIERVREDWVRAALLARDAGFDIVYAYGAHSHLPTQFLSPFYNHRTDEYGGSFQNRARFWLELIAAVRQAVGSDCAIAVRIGLVAPGLLLSESLEFIRAADHLVDLWDVNRGGIAEWWQDSGSSRFFGEGHQLALSDSVRAATDKPIVGVGRLTDPERMAAIVRSGSLDLIGGARPAIADPFLPNKVYEGRIRDIRECIGCNICIANSHSTSLICTQNPTAGEEYRRGWHPETFGVLNGKKPAVLVVGAGPSGMECALVLASRGARTVHLVDQAPDVGGHVAWLARLPGLILWRRVVDWRLTQLAELPNVDIGCGQPLSPADIIEYGADCVVIATGSTWSPEGLNAHTHQPIPGWDAPHVFTPEKVMDDSGARPEGESVVVYDAEGYLVGSSIAQELSKTNRVTLITTFSTVAPFCDATLEGHLLRSALHEAGVVFQTSRVVNAIEPDGVLTTDEFGHAAKVACDAVVLVTQRVSTDSVYHQLDAARRSGECGSRLYRIGDCLTPRLLADAVFDGHRLAMEIDSAHPETPLPYRHDAESVFDPAI